MAGVLGLWWQRVPNTDDLLLPRLQPPDLGWGEGLVADTLLHQTQECTHTLILQPDTHQQLGAHCKQTQPILVLLMFTIFSPPTATQSLQDNKKMLLSFYYTRLAIYNGPCNKINIFSSLSKALAMQLFLSCMCKSL